ncbi:MAG: LptF/LptG family permease [Gammaproteobacteria bacterium]|jgi:lipopolysaccharide export system permease protein|nr:LptF/LptG family permease [Gammaproteobacteria bacterium]
MKKILFRKFLYDCLVFFMIALISTSVIIWVFQAVNYLDLVIDDGRDYLIYLNYTFLNFPKILSKILPFAFFFSFSYVIAKYELNNELLIYWNFGINKITFVNYFLFFSIFLLFIQIILTAIIVPSTQSAARGLLRDSDYNFINNFIKIKKFNAAVNNLTIYTESKETDGSFNNIYIKKNTGSNNFQVTYAKKGVIKSYKDFAVLELYNGENINLIDNNLTSFSFSKSEFNLSMFSTNTILVTKTQEHKTVELLACVFSLTDRDIKDKKKIKEKVRNCEVKNLDNIIAEIYKRLTIPFYIPALMLVSLMLIIHSKEKVNYSNYRIIIFLIGFLIIVFSETTLRFINDSFYNNLIISMIPIMVTILFYFYFIMKFNFKRSK